jgi:DNA-binding XRE family transcriptional regulator
VPETLSQLVRRYPREILALTLSEAWADTAAVEVCMPVTDAQGRRRDAQGHLLSRAVAVSPAMEEEKRNRAKAWKKFRKDYLYSQEFLAQTLGCCRRVVTAVESGESIPTPRIQRAFRDLVREEKQKAAA